MVMAPIESSRMQPVEVLPSKEKPVEFPAVQLMVPLKEVPPKVEVPLEILEEQPKEGLPPELEEEEEETMAAPAAAQEVARVPHAQDGEMVYKVVATLDALQYTR
jgi:hypothetical protein